MAFFSTPISTPTRQERPRTTRNIQSVYLVDLQAIREQPGTVANIVILPYKEEVAGSIGHRPLRESVLLQEKRSAQERAPGYGLVLPPDL